ncbi:MAG: sigma-54 interaction domain-containing protein [Fibrobacterota bacterium]
MNCVFNEDQLSADCLNMVLETMAEAVILVDRDNTIRYCNKSCEDISGYTREDILGKNACEILRCSEKADCNLFENGNVHNAECQILHKTGRLIPILKSGRLIEADGAVVGAVETITDLSAQKESEDRIKMLEKQLKERSSDTHDIIAKSRIMENVFQQISFAANSMANTFISGESGTGKELVAKAIHNNSDRADAPFVAVNCSALPESLLESELFGHVKGAFTGAIRDKKGRITVADGGTLFLDEIGDISQLIQIKLLRFMQEKEFERVGDSATKKSDVRIITATNRNLEKLVSDGAFREDFYYRLKVFPIHLPPLRERKEDIPYLTAHFIRKFNAETGRAISGITENALEFLLSHNWKGNVRELENAIEHAFVTCQSDMIDVFNLPMDIRRTSQNPAEGPYDTLDFLSRDTTARRKPNREELLRALEKYRGNKSETAEFFGVNRSTLWRWMKRFEIET